MTGGIERCLYDRWYLKVLVRQVALKCVSMADAIKVGELVTQHPWICSHYSLVATIIQLPVQSMTCHGTGSP